MNSFHEQLHYIFVKKSKTVTVPLWSNPTILGNGDNSKKLWREMMNLKVYHMGSATGSPIAEGIKRENHKTTYLYREAEI